MTSQVITTKYIGATNFRSSRVKATAKRGQSLTLPWSHEGLPDDEHGGAAKALAESLDWRGLWIAGASERGNTYVRLGGVFSRGRTNKYMCGVEGRDWFYVGARS